MRHGITRFSPYRNTMKVNISKILAVLLSIIATAYFFYNTRALQYFGIQTKGKILTGAFEEVEYENDREIRSDEQLFVKYIFYVNGNEHSGIQSFSGEEVYSLIDDYFVEETDTDESFLDAFHDNPGHYLKGKPLKIIYFKFDPNRNTIAENYEQPKVIADVVLFAVVVFLLTVLFYAVLSSVFKKD